jgi:diamine N-acetyltransferase
MLQIQKLKPSDAARLSKLAIRAYSDHYLHLWTDAGQWYINKCFSIENLEIELVDTNNEFYIAVQDNEDAGFMKVRPSQNLEGQLGEGYEIERIYFKSKFTGKGLGSGLFEFALADAIQQSRQYIWLKSMDSAFKAIHFYQKHGFEVIDQTRLDFDLMLPDFLGMVVLRKIL